MRKSIILLTLIILTTAVSTQAADLYSQSPQKRSEQPSAVLNVLEIGMSFDEVISLLGQPDEVESSYFIGSHTDAIRYGSYWLISRKGQILECVVERRGFELLCSRIGGGCESRNCDWYLSNRSQNVLMR